ncbi:MAG: YdaU family protein [Methylophilus sp.]|jgi:uncharacterized protein YdaU (DUF1376 family)
MHYYQFNIADYRKDTTHLSMLEHGAYRQLIDWHYLDEMPIPKETEVVFRRLSARTEEEKNAILIVLKEMFLLTKDGYIQPRVVDEVKAYIDKGDRARENGKLGGRPKKTKVVISGLQNETEEKANSITKELNNSYKKPIVRKSSARFQEFWLAWPSSPRKVAKASCQKKWESKKLDEIADQIMKHLVAMKNTKQWLEGFEPAPLTYINQGRWADEIFTGTDATNTKPWYISSTGIDAKGKELGLVYLKDEQFPAYKVRVYAAAGITPEMVRIANSDFGRKLA